MNKLTASQHQRAKKLFWEVKEIAKEEREKYLTEVCGDDVIVINEVLTLLNTENEVGILDRGNAIELVVSEANLKVVGKIDVMEEKNKIDPTGLIGKKFNERYEIIRLLGEGGMGTVYLAKDTQIGKEVAIKVLLKATANELSNELTKRFHRECANLAKLEHPNIVNISSFDKTNFAEPTDNYYFLVMEYLKGEQLKNIIKTQLTALTLERKLKIIYQICLGLKEAHSKGITHRDINPSNMMISWIDGRDWVKIFDFGIAKANGDSELTTITKPGSVIGTYPYMPPEQFKTEEVNTKSDIYSLGIIIYQILSGKHPFGDTNVSLLHIWMYKHLQETPTSLSELCPNLPDKLVNIVMQMLAKNLIERPNIKEIIQELSKYVEKDIIYSQQVYSNEDNNNQSISITEITTVKMLAREKYKFVTAKLDNKGKVVKRIDKEGLQFIEDLGKGVVLEMVEIPSGEFMMGISPEDIEKVVAEYKRYGTSEENARSWVGRATPQHKVTVPTFYMGKYQVTQEQWEAVMGSNPSRFKGNGKLPIEQVSWNDAIKFCKRLSEKTNKIYRLPSEAEWEYACRAGTETPFAYGETINTDIVNYDGNYPYGEGAKGEKRGKTTIVGSLGVANNFGLYDMHGNVWEWCQDGWHDNYEGAPVDGSVWEKQGADNNSRLVRGGSWDTYASRCRSALRHWYAPGLQDSILGLRVVLVARTLK